MVFLCYRFTPEEKAKRPQLCHMPFGFGPRVCIGMRLALLEAKIALIELLKRYTFTRAPETEVATVAARIVLMIAIFILSLCILHFPGSPSAWRWSLPKA